MAEGEYGGSLLSADSHVMEPRDLWLKRIDAKWRDRAPRIERLDESGDYIVIDGMRPRPLAFEGPMADLKAQGMEIPGAERLQLRPEPARFAGSERAP